MTQLGRIRVTQRDSTLHSRSDCGGACERVLQMVALPIIGYWYAFL